MQPEFIPLDDYNDVCDILAATGRTIPAAAWGAEEVLEAAQSSAIERILE